MHTTLKRHIAPLKNTATAPQALPRWPAKTKQCPNACRFLRLTTSGTEGYESARQQLHDRFGNDATAMLAEYAADKRRRQILAVSARLPFSCELVGRFSALPSNITHTPSRAARPEQAHRARCKGLGWCGCAGVAGGCNHRTRTAGRGTTSLRCGDGASRPQGSARRATLVAQARGRDRGSGGAHGQPRGNALLHGHANIATGCG